MKDIRACKTRMWEAVDKRNHSDGLFRIMKEGKCEIQCRR